MSNLAPIRAMREAQALYDAMEDDSWEDGDPLMAAADELIAEGNRIRTLVEQGSFERAQSVARECANTANYIADLAQERIE